jgi:hypothetical protein
LYGLDVSRQLLVLARELFDVTPHNGKIIHHSQKLLSDLSDFVGLRRCCRRHLRSLI